MIDTFYSLYDKDNKIILSTITKEKLQKISSVSSLSTFIDFDDISFRYLKVKRENGFGIAITTNVDYKKSRKSFQKYLTTLVDSIDIVKELAEKATDELNISTHRLIHNLTSINAHNMQEIYSEFPQDELSGSGKKSIKFISQKMKSNSNNVSAMILRLAKNNAAMKAEFSVFKRLYDKKTEIDMSLHNVHRVLMNILYTFFPDFTDKGVFINVQEGNYKAYFDYDTVHVALYHLFDNAVKYTKINSELHILIKPVDDRIEVSFKMHSIVIEDNELDLIYQEGYSGVNAQGLYKSGHGIGMSRIKEMLTLNQATVNLIRVGQAIEEKSNGICLKYQENIITFSFLSYKATAHRN